MMISLYISEEDPNLEFPFMLGNSVNSFFFLLHIESTSSKEAFLEWFLQCFISLCFVFPQAFEKGRKLYFYPSFPWRASRKLSKGNSWDLLLPGGQKCSEAAKTFHHICQSEKGVVQHRHHVPPGDQPMRPAADQRLVQKHKPRTGSWQGSWRFFVFHCLLLNRQWKAPCNVRQ